MIKKLKLALATAIVFVGGVAGSAAAHRPGHPGNKGALDDAERAERKAAFVAKRDAMRKLRLARFDLDKDGKLDNAERQMMTTERASEQFKRLDVNGDGRLTLEEFKTRRMGRGGPAHHRGHGRRQP